ncbi:hypothetical protein BGZ68_006190 [Mortierella alpina]|nr:hypothetical protein BGZ68_006190 [Mortierella alpina]
MSKQIRKELAEHYHAHHEALFNNKDPSYALSDQRALKTAVAGAAGVWIVHSNECQAAINNRWTEIRRRASAIAISEYTRWGFHIPHSDLGINLQAVGMDIGVYFFSTCNGAPLCVRSEYMTATYECDHKTKAGGGLSTGIMGDAYLTDYGKKKVAMLELLPNPQPLVNALVDVIENAGRRGLGSSMPGNSYLLYSSYDNYVCARFADIGSCGGWELALVNSADRDKITPSMWLDLYELTWLANDMASAGKEVVSGDYSSIVSSYTLTHGCVATTGYAICAMNKNIANLAGLVGTSDAADIFIKCIYGTLMAYLMTRRYMCAALYDRENLAQAVLRRVHNIRAIVCSDVQNERDDIRQAVATALARCCCRSTGDIKLDQTLLDRVITRVNKSQHFKALTRMFSVESSEDIQEACDVAVEYLQHLYITRSGCSTCMCRADDVGTSAKVLSRFGQANVAGLAHAITVETAIALGLIDADYYSAAKTACLKHGYY